MQSLSGARLAYSQVTGVQRGARRLRSGGAQAVPAAESYAGE